MSAKTPTARDAVALFRSCFHRRPTVAASAPGRVNLIGEHTDYNGGPVLPLALRVRTTVAAAPAEGWEFASLIEPEISRLDPDQPMRQRWTDYLIGVIRVLRYMGAAPTGARVAVASSVPIGAGLSSSAALCVSAVRTLSLLAGRRLTPTETAEAAYRAEHYEVGVKCGRMDQTVATFARSGSALLFETGSGTIRTVPMPAKVWVMETGVSHQLAGGALNQRRRECEEALAILRDRGYAISGLAQLKAEDLSDALALLPPLLGRRVRHVVTETTRTRRAADLLIQRDLVTFGRVLVEGHESLRVDYQSTVPEADYLVQTAMKHGAYGARLTGAGWGGAVIALIPPEKAERAVAEIGGEYQREYGVIPGIWWSRAASGVRREPV
jgi:galactokinase